MQKINYGLIVSDFDGTLAQENGEISEENKNAIARYRASGGQFAISTGRMHYGILPRAKELGLHGLISCCQGALIVDIDSGEPVLNGRLSHEVTLAICRKMEEMDLHYHVYDFKDFYCNKDDEALKYYENAVKKKANLITEQPLSAFVEERKIRAYKVLAMLNPKDNARVMQELKEMHFSGCSVTKSADVLVEVINESYSKGTAVEFLAKYYQVFHQKDNDKLFVREKK